MIVRFVHETHALTHSHSTSQLYEMEFNDQPELFDHKICKQQSDKEPGAECQL